MEFNRVDIYLIMQRRERFNQRKRAAYQCIKIPHSTDLQDFLHSSKSCTPPWETSSSRSRIFSLSLSLSRGKQAKPEGESLQALIRLDRHRAGDYYSAGRYLAMDFSSGQVQSELVAPAFTAFPNYPEHSETNNRSCLALSALRV